MDSEKKKIYFCPMHPEVMQDKPGRCPDCSMNLAIKKEAVSQGCHGSSGDKHAGHSPEMFKNKFWVSLILTVPVVVLHFFPIKFTGSQYVPVILGTFLFFYSGLVFIKSAGVELKNKQPGMMTLISLAIIVSFVYSAVTTFLPNGMDFFWELSSLVTIMILGHWIEMSSIRKAQDALGELAKLLPDTAEIVRGEKIEKVLVSILKISDIVLVRPGGKIPVDGKVIEGKTEANESMLTGESNPVLKGSGSEVIAGTVNGNGSIKVRVTKIGESTALAWIMRLVAKAQESKSKAQVLADRAAFYLTIVAVGSAIVTLVAWLALNKGIGFSIERMATVLIIACPHALGLAIPLVISISTSLAARNGLLVKQRPALELARNIDVVLFDKTGTLTKAEHGVSDVWPIGISQSELLRISASVENNSEHPVARAIVSQAQKAGVRLMPVSNFSAIPGQGVKALLQGIEFFAGGLNLLFSNKINLPEEFSSKIEKAGLEGKTVVYVFSANKIIGAITLADLVRVESKDAVKKLQAQNIRVAMVTGDSYAVAKSVAIQLGIKEFFAEVLPGDKAEKVRELQKDGSKVAMVGDGVNDAPALAQADIGIAIGAGTDVAIESAGIILVKNDPNGVLKIIKLSKAAYGKMRQNLAWAVGYNVLAIPLASGLFGFALNPAIGALLMSASTIIVALNAQFLRRLRL